MQIDKEELKITADLSQLKITEEEMENFRHSVEDLLVYFEKMNQIEVSHLEPTTHVLSKDNRPRKDKIISSSIADEILACAPEEEDSFIIIPNVL